MNSIPPASSPRRQSMAVGIWSLLLVSLGMLPQEVSFLLAIVLAMSVSMGISLSLLISCQIHSDDRQRVQHLRWVSASICFGTAILWALFLGNRVSNVSSAYPFVLTAVVVSPILATWLLDGNSSLALESLDRSALPGIRRRNSKPPAASLPGGQRSSLLNDDVRPTVPGETHSLAEDDTAELDDQFSDDLCEMNEVDFHPLHGSDQSNSLIADDETPATNVTQWLTRSRTDTGELIEGGVRIEFAESQRDLTAHISFCPPFKSIPDVTTEDLDAADLEIRVAAVFPYGMRLTIRRPSHGLKKNESIPAEAYRIGFVAMTTSVQRAA